MDATKPYWQCAECGETDVNEEGTCIYCGLPATNVVPEVAEISWEDNELKWITEILEQECLGESRVAVLSMMDALKTKQDRINLWLVKLLHYTRDIEWGYHERCRCCGKNLIYHPFTKKVNSHWTHPEDPTCLAAQVEEYLQSRGIDPFAKDKEYSHEQEK